MRYRTPLRVSIEKPAPKIVSAWGGGFESAAGETVAHPGLSAEQDFEDCALKAPPSASGSITRHSSIDSASLDDTELIADGDAFIKGSCDYEVTPLWRDSR